MQDAEHPELAQGRYVVYGEIASGGMATVEYGRRVGPLGFARPVAIKRPHAQFLKDPSFVAMFVDEARLGARLHHANIVSILDLVDDEGRLALVMEYVHGETLASLLELAKARGEPVPIAIAAALISAVLHGLHAAHETRADNGELLGIVHRDVSPQNILIGQDGAPRVLDFGIAKGTERMTATPGGQIKGKLLYMPPEQLRAEAVDRRADVFSASAVLWEVLTGRELFDAPSEAAVMQAVLERQVALPSSLNPEVPEALDRIVLKGLVRDRNVRYATAREMALAIERALSLATASELSAWVQHLAGDKLAARARSLQTMQASAEAKSAARIVSRAAIQAPTPLASTVDTASSVPARSMLGMLAIGTVALVLLALLILWRINQLKPVTGKEATPEPAPKAESSVPPVEPTATQHREALRPQPEPAVEIEPELVAPKERVRKVHTVVPTRSSPPQPAPQCAQPYRIDAQGIRHPKPECL